MDEPCDAMFGFFTEIYFVSSYNSHEMGRGWQLLDCFYVRIMTTKGCIWVEGIHFRMPLGSGRHHLCSIWGGGELFCGDDGTFGIIDP